MSYINSVMSINYLNRIVDSELKFKLDVFGAINIVGPKWCGKTTTALKFSKSKILLQNAINKEALIRTAQIDPNALLNGDNPRLIDEWQDAPPLWDAVRSMCDMSDKKGLYILTGSTSQKVSTSHTGTGRISKLQMHTMSLYESLESNGCVSLEDLFNNKRLKTKSVKSDLTISGLIKAAARGGWPESLRFKNFDQQLAISRDYFRQIYETDIFNVDNVRRNSETCEMLLRSYARNISTLAKKSSIIKDINNTTLISEPTFDDYHNVLKQLFIIDDLPAWNPSIRSRSAIRKTPKREFSDPSIVIAALGVRPEYFNMDLLTFGFIFETLCIRDLRVYSQKLGGKLSYYHDKTGLEADSVLQLDDGRYAIIEFKLGQKGIDEGAKNLNKIEDLCKSSAKTKVPDLKIVITATEFGYLRPDGVFVIPIGCLKD